MARFKHISSLRQNILLHLHCMYISAIQDKHVTMKLFGLTNQKMGGVTLCNCRCLFFLSSLQSYDWYRHIRSYNLWLSYLFLVILFRHNVFGAIRWAKVNVFERIHWLRLRQMVLHHHSVYLSHYIIATCFLTPWDFPNNHKTSRNRKKLLIDWLLTTMILCYSQVLRYLLQSPIYSKQIEKTIYAEHWADTDCKYTGETECGTHRLKWAEK